MASVSAVCAALLAAILVHELGHYTAAMALEFEVLASLLDHFAGVGFTGSRPCNFPGNDYSHAQFQLFPAGEKNWRSEMLVVIGAGPAATLLMLAIFWSWR